MFFKSWRLGRVLGFPVEVNLTFLLLLAFVLIAYGGLVGVFVVLLAFGSVFLHELGHAVVARRLGVHVAGIELSFFGGAAKMTQMPRSPSHEIAIAAAGPAVSVALSVIGFSLAVLFGSPLLALIGWINLVIAGFNLIPALPMDGGRILRAVLATRYDYVRATDISVRIARGFTILFAVVALAYGLWHLLLITPFLWLMTSHEQRVARMVGDQPVGFGPGGSGRGGVGPDGIEVLGRDAWDRRGPGWGSPFERAAPPDAGWPLGGHTTMRRFTIRRLRDGRLVIEAVD
jgi:Zn-dependent protease